MFPHYRLKTTELRSPTLPGSSESPSPRSFLPIPMTNSRRLSPPRQSPTIKSTASTPNIRKMAAVAPLPTTTISHSPTHFRLGSESLSTLRDPRSEIDLRAAARESAPHPDLNLEVAALSNKLISAINHQTHLDDALASAREELRQSRDLLKQSEARNAEYESQVKEGIWVKREEVDERTSELFRKFSVEKKSRELAEREKRAIESELADLSTKLFEEANQLVVKARKETEAADSRTEQVRGQLAEAESLLASHQEQLIELKAMMERSADQEEADGTNVSTAPSTPALGQGVENQGPYTPQFAHGDRVDPAPALKFSHLVAPILRNDVPSFEDFRGLLEINRKIASAPASRANSGTYAGLGIPSMPVGGNAQQIFYGNHSQTLSNGSSTNLAAVGSQPHSPSQSANSTISAGSALYSPTFTPLRETKFFKRALAEDIDPTLRLDAAPGLSFFARRSVTAAIHDNTLVLEPLPSSSRKLITSCTLCGERRRGDQYSRTHRFKAGDDSAQWYPLCNYCVGRLRSTCDYIAFLRMLREGLWRCDGEKGEEKAWEESVRLRECMFWARIGGGVVPIPPSAREDGLESRMGSKRPSLDVGKRRSKEVGQGTVADSSKPGMHTPPQSASSIDNNSPGADYPRNSEEVFEIRELPSTAPPLQASSATVSPTSVVYPRSGGSETPTSASPTDPTSGEPFRQSIAASLRRISLRDSLRFGSSSRSASKDRASGVLSPGIESPRLGAVAEMRAVYEHGGEEKTTTEDLQASSEPKPVVDAVENKQEVANADNHEVVQGQESTRDQEIDQGHERQMSDGLNISVPGGFL